MSVTDHVQVDSRAVKAFAAGLIGLGLGTLVPPDPVSLPAVGSLSGFLVGGAGLVAGAVLYLRCPSLVGTGDCGCSGECGDRCSRDA